MSANSNIPHHLAIIPDGNRRWAKTRMLRPWQGHQQGAAALQKLFETAMENGVRYITFWGASEDNLLNRGKQEVKFLLKIIGQELSRPELADFLNKHMVRVRFLGQWKNLVSDKSLKAVFESLERQTKNFNRNYLTVLFAYDGKREMLQAINQHKQSGPALATEENFRKLLLTGELPDVDLVIRTGGQPHWSAGFMMWLTANSQFYFTKTLWPDFNSDELRLALRDYAGRDRKMGK